MPADILLLLLPSVVHSARIVKLVETGVLVCLIAPRFQGFLMEPVLEPELIWWKRFISVLKTKSAKSVLHP